MSVLTKATILAVDDRETKDVPVPEWGGDVRLAVLTGTQRDRWEQLCVDRTGPKDHVRLDQLKVALLAEAIIDPDTGEKMFSPQELDVLNGKNSAVIQRLFTLVRQMNGIGDEAMSELAGN